MGMAAIDEFEKPAHDFRLELSDALSAELCVAGDELRSELEWR